MRRATQAAILFICTAAAVLVSCVCARNGLPANSKGGEGIETMLYFYRTQSAWTDPGEHLSMYEGIPDGIGEVVEVVQNVLVHGGLLWLYELTPTEQQGGGMNIRKTAEMLERIAQLKSGSITIPRAADQRLVVNCRQFAVLTCSILRSKGVPARVRAGYALYTWRQGKYENHWICEYWHPAERRWVQVDAQIDAAQRKLMQIDFDTLDMPQGRFVVAGEGWQRYRQGEVGEEAFGLGGRDGWNAMGWRMVMPNVVCDTMALNKDELLPWDVPPYWSKEQAGMSAADTELIDRLAAAHWSESRSLYDSHPALHMPKDFEKQKQK